MTMRRECAYCLYVRDMADDKAICPSCEQWYARAIRAMQLLAHGERVQEEKA